MTESGRAQARATSAIALGLISGAGMALAAWLLIAPDVGPPPRIPFQDKIFHFLAFACLTGPAIMVLPRSARGFWVAHMLALGAGIEVVQTLSEEGRTGSFWDFLADAAGVAAAVWLGGWLRLWLPWLRADEPAGLPSASA